MEKSVTEYFEKIESEAMKKEKEKEKQRMRLLQVCLSPAVAPFACGCCAWVCLSIAATVGTVSTNGVGWNNARDEIMNAGAFQTDVFSSCSPLQA